MENNQWLAKRGIKVSRPVVYARLDRRSSKSFPAFLSKAVFAESLPKKMLSQVCSEIFVAWVLCHGRLLTSC